MDNWTPELKEHLKKTTKILKSFDIRLKTNFHSETDFIEMDAFADIYYACNQIGEYIDELLFNNELDNIQFDKNRMHTYLKYIFYKERYSIDYEDDLNSFMTYSDVYDDHIDFNLSYEEQDKAYYVMVPKIINCYKTYLKLVDILKKINNKEKIDKDSAKFRTTLHL